MDRRMYYRSAGLSAARRAFYSYTAQPRGSYGLPLIFLKMLKAQKVITFEEDKERWRSFLCDYIVFRLYIAKYVLKSYARDYSPLTELYAGFKDAEKDWPGFIRSSSDPGWKRRGFPSCPKIFLRIRKRKWTITMNSSTGLPKRPRRRRRTAAMH